MSRTLNKAFLVMESDPFRYAPDPPGAYTGLVLNWTYIDFIYGPILMNDTSNDAEFYLVVPSLL